MPTVVVIRSLSFTGTTWINLLLGCHPRTLALGPPQGKWELTPDRAGEACALHGRRCPLWFDFIKTWDRGGSFFGQLAEWSGRDIIVLNNPTRALRERELVDPSFTVKHVHVVRDGRANVASCMRHHPDRYDSVYDATRQWLRPATERVMKEMAELDDVLFVRYEDAVADPHSLLERAGLFLGIEYPEDATRYWTFEHHLLSGNTGFVDMLMRMQGERGFGEHARKDYYDKLLEHTRRNPDVQVVDESWRDRLSLQDRFAFDYVFGDLHETLGYARDRFTVDETRRCLDDWGLPLEPDALPEHAPRVPGERVDYTDAGSAGDTERVIAYRGGARQSGEGCPDASRAASDAHTPVGAATAHGSWLSRLLGRI